jgi:hypothetical protein
MYNVDLAPNPLLDWAKTPRKEVIHPQVLLRIPCYDLVPVSCITLGPRSKTKGTLGTPTFHDLTGGEYKTREHIQRDMADSRLLAIPAS